MEFEGIYLRGCAISWIVHKFFERVTYLIGATNPELLECSVGSGLLNSKSCQNGSVGDLHFGRCDVVSMLTKLKSCLDKSLMHSGGLRKFSDFIWSPLCSPSETIHLHLIEVECVLFHRCRPSGQPRLLSCIANYANGRPIFLLHDTLLNLRKNCWLIPSNIRGDGIAHKMLYI